MRGKLAALDEDHGLRSVPDVDGLPSLDLAFRELARERVNISGDMALKAALLRQRQTSLTIIYPLSDSGDTHKSICNRTTVNLQSCMPICLSNCVTLAPHHRAPTQTHAQDFVR